jgi:hypothetical protein
MRGKKQDIAADLNLAGEKESSSLELSSLTRAGDDQTQSCEEVTDYSN